MNVTFLMTHIPNPRMNKRIAAAKAIGANVTVICTRRKSQDVWEIAHHDVLHVEFDVDLPSANHIFRRVLLSRRFTNGAYKQLCEVKPDVIYCEGMDMLLLAARYLRRHEHVRLIYEVADLREVYFVKPKSLQGKLKRVLLTLAEKRGLVRISGLVLTSERFYEAYYHRMIPRSKVLIMPNLPDLSAFRDYRPKESGAFTVGFIGAIRYLEQMRMLVDAAEVCGTRVLFAGAGGTSVDGENITAYCAGKPHVEFTGKYCYDAEIAALYGRIDCVYAVYDADNPNVRIALPNKLYEAICCELPIIVAKGTYLAELVEAWQVGIAVSHTDPSELTDALVRLMNDKVYYNCLLTACRRKKTEFFTSGGDATLEAVLREKSVE